MSIFIFVTPKISAKRTLKQDSLNCFTVPSKVYEKKRSIHSLCHGSASRDCIPARSGLWLDHSQDKPNRHPRTCQKECVEIGQKENARPAADPKEKRQPLENGDWDLSQFQVPEEKGRKRFHDFDLPLEVMHAISDLSFHYCTPIQAEILAHTLQGRDATGKAQTGTGKSAAFLINILTTLLTKSPPKGAKNATPRSLIIAPTRELVMQIAEDAEKLAAYSDIHIVPIYGGMDYQKQLDDIQGQQVDIVAATPGRLLDFQRKRQINLSDVEIFVIDEADRMLDMGFIPDVRQIVHSLPDRGQRQTLFFSATLTPEVNHLADQWTKDPAVVEIETEHATVDSIDQLVYLVTTDEKFPSSTTLLSPRIFTRSLSSAIASQRPENLPTSSSATRSPAACSPVMLTRKNALPP